MRISLLGILGYLRRISTRSSIVSLNCQRQKFYKNQNRKFELRLLPHSMMSELLLLLQLVFKAAGRFQSNNCSSHSYSRQYTFPAQSSMYDRCGGATASSPTSPQSLLSSASSSSSRGSKGGGGQGAVGFSASFNCRASPSKSASSSKHNPYRHTALNFCNIWKKV